MFITNILKNFSKDTKILYKINGNIIEDIKTVGDWLNSGLCSNIILDSDKTLKIENDTIIIEL